jgi:hypothetical protein
MEDHLFQIIMLAVEAIIIPAIGFSVWGIFRICNKMVRLETLIGNGLAKTVERIESKCPACVGAIASLDTRLSIIERKLDQVEVINHRLDKIEHEPVCATELERIAERLIHLGTEPIPARKRAAHE